MIAQWLNNPFVLIGGLVVLGSALVRLLFNKAARDRRTTRAARVRERMICPNTRCGYFSPG